MLFFNKKPSIDQDLTTEVRLKKIEARLQILEGETLALNVSIDSIRNKVLKKIQFKKEKEAEEEEKSKDLYSGVLLPDR